MESLYLRHQGCEDPWLFFEAKKGRRAKKGLRNTVIDYLNLEIMEVFLESMLQSVALVSVDLFIRFKNVKSFQYLYKKCFTGA